MKTFSLTFKIFSEMHIHLERTNFSRVASLQKKNIIAEHDKDNFHLHPHHSLYKWTPAPTPENPEPSYIHDFFPASFKENFCSVNENYIHCSRSPPTQFRKQQQNKKGERFDKRSRKCSQMKRSLGTQDRIRKIPIWSMKIVWNRGKYSL